MNRSEGKGRVDPCVICGEDRFTDKAHFPKKKSREGNKTIFLCPTHHKLLDNARLSEWELNTIWKKEFNDKADTFEKFMEWANEQGYQYTLSDIKGKRIWKETSKTR